MEEFRLYYPDNWDNKKGDVVDLQCTICRGFLGWGVQKTVPIEAHMVHDFAVIGGKVYCRDHAHMYKQTQPDPEV